MSDFQQHYQQFSHAELYNQLMVGKPEQVNDLASDWVTMERTLDDLARSLRADLDRLAKSWDSASGEEFRRRVEVIATYASNLAADFRDVHEGLTLMSDALREALQKAEHPDETDDYDQTVKSALLGGVVAGPAGLVVGGIYGYHKDKEEQEKAHQRMVQLVANLAADYDLTKEVRWYSTTPVPADLPGGGPSGPGAAPLAGPGPRGVSAAPTVGQGGPIGNQDVPAPGTVREGPGTGNGTVGEDIGTVPETATGGTSLAGAGGGSGTGLLGAGWTAGATGLVAAAGGSVHSGSLPAQTTTPSAGLLGAPGGTGGVLNGRGGLDANRAAMGPARGVGSARGVLSGSRGPDIGIHSGNADTGRSAAGTGKSLPATAHRGSAADENEPDERFTWLTEDEMVWQVREAPPPVLGM